MQKMLTRFGGSLTFDMISSYVATNPSPPVIPGKSRNLRYRTEPKEKGVFKAPKKLITSDLSDRRTKSKSQTDREIIRRER